MLLHRTSRFLTLCGRLILVLLFLGLAAASLSAPTSQAGREGPFPAFLEGNEPSYFVFVGRPSHYVSYLLSVKYPIRLFDRKQRLPTPDRESWFSRLQPFITYTAKYDFFYLGARSSEPVLIRLQNVGLKLGYVWPASKALHLKGLALGYYHESNGQVIDTRQQYLDGGTYAQDAVSRGWDYVGSELRFFWPSLGLFGQSKASLNVYVRANIFLPLQLGGADIEDVIFWDPSHPKTSIRQYDGLRWIAILRNPIASLLIQLRSGYAGPGLNLSFNGQVTCRLFDHLPATFLFFHGFGRDISSYQVRDSYVGFGLELW